MWPDPGRTFTELRRPERILRFLNLERMNEHGNFVYPSFHSSNVARTIGMLKGNQVRQRRRFFSFPDVIEVENGSEECSFQD